MPFDEELEPKFLVLRYRESDSNQPAPEMLGACFPNVYTVAARDTELVWLAVEGFSVRDGVRLAKTKINNKTVSHDTDFVQRHSIALSRPRIASGATIPGATTWQIWNVMGRSEQAVRGGVFALQVKLDTSSAGFTTPPAYFASLQGPLVVRADKKSLTAIALHFDHVDQATINSFVFRFLVVVFDPVAGELSEPEGDIRKFLQQQKAYVSWLGIEPSRNDQSILT